MLNFHPYRITQDENNYIVQQIKKRKNGDEYWDALAYYGHNQLDLALNNVFNRKIAAADKQEIAHCMKAIVSAKNEILEAVKCLKK